VDPLSAKLLAGEVHDGSEVTVDVKGDEIVLEIASRKGGR